MKRLSPRNFLAFCLLTLTALLAANCSSNSDSSSTDSSPEQNERRQAQSLPSDSDSSNTDGSSAFAEAATPDNPATAIVAGLGHSCALREGGTISCWGFNGGGQLGDGSAEGSRVPVGVAGIDDATAIAAGGVHSCALRHGGAISCWGFNGFGQLGDRSDEGSRVYDECPLVPDEDALVPDECSLVPVGVVDIDDATAIAAGGLHSCALRQGGTISCWGFNEYGQLGDGSDEGSLGSDEGSLMPDFSSVPVGVVGIDDATAIAAGGEHSCALREGGAISCWGNNWGGQLGDGSYDDFSLVPVDVVSITDAIAITAGNDHSCALRRGGAISCWGYDLGGRLGNGSDEDSRGPVGVVGIDDATAVAAGGEHSCALRRGGAISCWGINRGGQLGDGSYEGSLGPVGVVGVDDATAVAAGGGHSCALRQGGVISCWGDNEYGQLGDGSDDDFSRVPVGVADVTAIIAGGGHS